MTDTNLPGSPDAVVLTRTIAVSIAQAWELWADAAHFQQWYGPKGANIPLAEFDAQIGGARKVCMEMNTPNGPMQMWFVGKFVTLNEPDLIEYTEALGDADGNVLPPSAMGMPDDHPMVTQVSVRFTAVDDTTTSFTLTHAGIPADSPGASGWAMALDKLQTYASA